MCKAPKYIPKWITDKPLDKIMKTFNKKRILQQTKMFITNKTPEKSL